MVVDDSVVIRGLIKRTLGSHSGLNVVSMAGNGQAAVDKLQALPVDVIVLDIEMPVMDGITALPKLLAVDPDVKIIIASTLSTRNADISIRCLEAGAADYIPKPTSARDIGGTGEDIDRFGRELVEKVVTLGRIARRNRPTPLRRGGHPPRRGGPPTRDPTAPRLVVTRPLNAVRPDVVAIGSSTGGPHALKRFLGNLAAPFKLPILITQHMPPTFTNIFAKHLAAQTRMACAEAVDGEAVVGGRVYIAPGDFHMVVECRGAQRFIRLNQRAPENFCRPAVDPLFRSIADAYGRRALAIVLTGMGCDGLIGARELTNAGGMLVAQDEHTSVVWGMPGAVAEAGLCNAVLPLDGLADLVTKIVAGRAP